jgi:GGDEF domain-containing protein
MMQRGDEFTVLLIDADLDMAQQIAERIGTHCPATLA